MTCGERLYVARPRAFVFTRKIAFRFAPLRFLFASQKKIRRLLFYMLRRTFMTQRSFFFRRNLLILFRRSRNIILAKRNLSLQTKKHIDIQRAFFEVSSQHSRNSRSQLKGRRSREFCYVDRVVTPEGVG